MPFTLSHAVLAPPLSKLSKGQLPIAALAIGCMTPDLYRLLVKTEIHLNHQWQGLFYPDLFVGLFFCLLWYGLYRPTLFKILVLSHPLPIFHFYSFLSFSLKVCFAILLGTTTHIIWDGLTHLDFRTFAFHEFLAQSVTLGPYNSPMHRILQIGSSILALPVVLWMYLQFFLKYRLNIALNRKVKNLSILLFSLTFICGLLSYFMQLSTFPIHLSTDLYMWIGFFMKTFTQGAIISFSFGCMIFLYFTRKCNST
ncbi:MAG: DUF4184 family protein [Moraxellaceae bacterium]|nr:DUF4184 family protein [Moraxellaceae bacterium]